MAVRTIDTEREGRTELPPSSHGHGRSRLLGVVVGAVVAAVYFIGAGRALDYDGSVTVGAFVRRGSLLDVFRTVYSFNNHPYFSFFEHLVWDAGGQSEPWLRVVPIACAAATAGLLTAWAARRWGAAAGLMGGTVLAANPMFADLGRSVRGYSLMVLGCTVATMVLVDAHGRSGAMTKRQSVVYAVALGVAIGTQFYAVLVLAAHVATLTSQRRFDAAWRRRIEVVVAIGALPYAAMLRALYESVRTRRGTFQPRFPVDVARAVLGQQYVAVAALAALTICALSVAADRRPLQPAVVVVAAAMLAIWLVMHPLDLYPRFLVWLVPAVAVAAAAAIGRRPMLASVAILATLAMAFSQASSWTTDPIASRQLARIVERARAEGQTPCAAGYSSEVILGYTRRVRSVFTVSQLAGCDSLFADTDTSSVQVREFRCRFARADTLPGLTKIVVFSEPAPTPANARCPA
jgi:hypothetical protein